MKVSDSFMNLFGGAILRILGLRELVDEASCKGRKKGDCANIEAKAPDSCRGRNCTVSPLSGSEGRNDEREL
jgi:hypothetical protein